MHNLYIPYLPESSKEYANDAINSGWISSLGKYPEIASNLLAEKMGVKHALLTNNGTTATHLTTICLKEFFPNVKNVIVPGACYVAAYNSLVYENYKEIRASDLDLDTWNMSIKPDTVDDHSAIMAVHNLGGIINIPKLLSKYNVPIIEDNCEGFFGSYEGKPSGSKSFCSSLSFFGNKNITTGEGGAFITDNENVYEFAKKVHGQGQTQTRYIHDILGYNYRMTNIQAALLLGQLEEYEYILQEKNRVYNRYQENLKDNKFISFQKNEANTIHSMWMMGIKFHHLSSYEDSYNFFNLSEIQTRPMFYPHNRHKHLSIHGSCPNSEILHNQVTLFPSHIFLSNNDIDHICSRIIDFTGVIFQQWADKNDFI